MGGKIEEEDNNDPLTTAYNELVEEVGDVILNDTWRERVTSIKTFQDASQKWIWCNLLELTTDEYQKLKLFDSVHDQWENSKERDFTSITNRSELSRKAVLGLVEVDSKDIVKYIREFSYIPSPSNSMSFCDRSKVAKDYRKGNVLYAHRLFNHQDEYQLSLRAFNTVIFEQHFETIKNRIFNL